MGFFGLLKSIEELLYEVMTWLVFYPRTMWQVIRHPHAMLSYSDVELTENADKQYTDTLSPPLFLMLTILLTHGLELAVGKAADVPVGRLGKLFADSEEMLLLFSSVTFSIFPLMFSVAMLKRSAQPLDRTTLRPPFFAQCYLAALLALLLSISSLMDRSPVQGVAVAGGILLIAAVAWYLTLQTQWLRRRLDLNWTKAILLAIGTFLTALFWVTLLSLALLV